MNNIYLYHHKEISFCGHSGSGKTTLICSILDELNSNYRIGYIKHDAHNFQMDKPGKDTYKARKSGADTVFISNESEFCFLGNGLISNEIIKRVFECFDFIMVEGHKKTPLPKIITFNEQEDLIKTIDDSNVEGILAFCGKDDFIEPYILESFPLHYNALRSLPYFQRDDIENISKFILQKVRLQI